MSFVETYSIANDTANGLVNTTTLRTAIDEEEGITTALNDSPTTDEDADELAIPFKGAGPLPGGEKTLLDAIVAAHEGDSPAAGPQLVEVLHAEQADGALRVALQGRIGSDTTQVSHNLCDPTTWYTQSVEVDGEALVDSGDGLTWNSANAGWIDVTHGKVYNERALRPVYPVKVYIDAVEATPRAPFADSGGDYVVDYAAGTVTFAADQSGKVITADYHHEAGSCWALEPTLGMKLIIEEAEAQFSDPCVWNDGVIQEVVMYAAAAVALGLPQANRDGTTTPLGPTDLVSGGGSVPDLSRVPIAVRAYDTMGQVMTRPAAPTPRSPPSGARSGGPPTRRAGSRSGTGRSASWCPRRGCGCTSSSRTTTPSMASGRP